MFFKEYASPFDAAVCRQGKIESVQIIDLIGVAATREARFGREELPKMGKAPGVGALT
jgi:hypothetical protein